MKAARSAVVYLRVSTTEQAETGTSLESQELVCLRKASEIGAPVVAVYRDEGVSGAYYVTRAGIQAALADIEAGRANILIMAKLDRSGRDVDVIRDIKRRAEQAGGKLVFCDGMNFESNAVGKLAFTTLAGFAEFEKEIIRERTMNGRRKRAEEGRQPNRSFHPYGYHVVTKEDVLAGRYPSDSLGTYQLLPDQADVVRQIFMRYGAGQSLYQLTCWLDENRVPTARGGTRWYKSTVKVLLNNPVYKGEAIFGRSEALRDERRVHEGRKPEYRRVTSADRHVRIEAPAIVPAELWDRCQRRLGENKELSSGNPTRRYMLGGLIDCPTCGRKLSGKRVGTTRYYTCRTSMSRQPCSDRKHLRARDLEAMVTAALVHTAARPELVSAAIEAYDDANRAADASPSIDALRKELAELEREEQAAVQAQIAGIRLGMSPEAYAPVFAAIVKRRAVLEAGIKDREQGGQKASDPVTSGEKVAAVLRSVEHALTSPDVTDAEKQNLLTTVVDWMETAADGLRIVLRSQTVHTVWTVCPTICSAWNGTITS